MKPENFENSFIGKFYLLYKVGRFGFSTGLFFLFLSLYSVDRFPFDVNSLFILAVFSLISFFSLLSSRNPSLFEFLLDELFIFVLVIDNIFSYGFFSIFLMFPVFFSVLFLPRSYGFLVTGMAVVYQFFYFVLSGRSINSALQFGLVSTALVAMMLAAGKLKRRLENQEVYIRSLEKERERSEVYRRLYEISADLAHELKNPLASIKGAVELLKEGKITPKIVDIIYKETARLDRIVKDFLNLARPASPVKSRIHIPTAVKEILLSMEHYGKNYELYLEDLTVETDARAFYSALENLIRNAFQWADSKVLISCRREGNWIEVVVEDNGPGVSEEDVDRIFEPFYSRHPGGSGLGLPIVKKFAIEQGGNVKVGRSFLGGARFVLRLPVKGERI